MIISLVEIGVWASWSASKYVGSSIWSLLSYSIWGYVPTEDEKFKALLLKRITDLEKSNEELTAAVLAYGENDEQEKNHSKIKNQPKIKQSITYIKDDKKPPPPPASSSVLALPIAPSNKINIHTAPKKKAILL